VTASTERQRELVTRFAAVLGTIIKDKDARIIGRRLEQLHKKHDGLTAKSVLEDARRARSPLHKYFEWDDTVAAEKWRLNQASDLVRSVRVIIEETGEEPREMRAFVSVYGEQKKKVYLPAIEAMEDEDYRKQILDRLKKELTDVKKRYCTILDVAELFDAIDTHVRRVEARCGKK
jgi:hypothetical protein